MAVYVCMDDERRKMMNEMMIHHIASSTISSSIHSGHLPSIMVVVLLMQPDGFLSPVTIIILSVSTGVGPLLAKIHIG